MLVLVSAWLCHVEGIRELSSKMYVSTVCMRSNLRLCILCLIAEEAHADR